MTKEITNIRPDYDYHYDQYDSRNNWASGILRFDMDGEERFEFIDLDGRLGRFIPYSDDRISALSDIDGRVVRGIHGQLKRWIAANEEVAFVTESDDADIVAIHHGINVGSGIEVELTPEAIERLNISGNSFEVDHRGVISWKDRDFGRQEIDNGSAGDQELLTLAYNLSKPGELTFEIEDRLEQLRAEAELDDDQDAEVNAA